ncbi:MAG: glycoside-pentoside-hexuronide (GPH):cation symporter [Tannerella sp.]|jgi:GPH family glycoside/pentoside/hexuronide:cation symporter|nr:glycoside-pentoside-hexuronide (GPH):cation symporter [Tannerella sp.]
MSGKVPFKEKLAYGTGDVGNNFIFQIGQLYLLKFYTDTLGLPAATAGLVFLVTKIWDGFVDISVGAWIDRRKPAGQGNRFRPFMRHAAVPLALITVVSLTAPDFTLTGKTIWAFVTYMAFGVAYSLFNIPYGSMVPVISQESVERADLAAFRWTGSTTGLLLTTVGFIPIVRAFEDVRTGYVVAGAVFALAGLLLQGYCYANIREHYEVEKPERTKEKWWVNYRVLRKNAPLLIICIANLFTFSAYNVKLAVQVFYCQYTLGDISIVPRMGFFSIGCIYAGVAVVPFLVRHFGKKATFITGAAIWGIADLAAYFLADGVLSFICFACAAFFGSSLINTLNWAFVSDAVEYGEWKTGIRAEGTVYSFFTFFRKISQAAAGFIPGLVLALVGYVPNAVQTPEAIRGINGLMFLYPGTLALATFVLVGWTYKLSDRKYGEIVAELNTRKSAANEWRKTV